MAGLEYGHTADELLARVRDGRVTAPARIVNVHGNERGIE